MLSPATLRRQPGSLRRSPFWARHCWASQRSAAGGATDFLKFLERYPEHRTIPSDHLQKNAASASTSTASDHRSPSTLRRKDGVRSRAAPAVDEGLAFALGPCPNHDPVGAVVRAAGATARTG